MFDRRGGVSIVEALVAMVLIGVVTIGVARLLGPVVRLQRASQRRLVAITEVANFAEGLMGVEYDELTPAWANTARMSDVARARLPGASFRVTVREIGSHPAAKQIQIELDWQIHLDESMEPVRTVAWKYAPPLLTDP